MDNVRLNVPELHTGIRSVKNAKAKLETLKSSISSVDLSGSDLTTKGNLTRASSVVTDAINEVNKLEKNLNTTKDLLIKNSRETQTLFDYLDNPVDLLDDTKIRSFVKYQNAVGRNVTGSDISGFLKRNGSSLEEYNKYIESHVNNAGYGTRAGVVAAATSTVTFLYDNFDARLPYQKKSQDPSAFLKKGIPDGKTFDCSSFVTWSLVNGGYNPGTKYSADQMMNESLPGTKAYPVNEHVGKPGDLIASHTHVQMIVSVDESSGTYTVAEAKGGYGVILSEYSFDQKHQNANGIPQPTYIVNMDGFYNNSDNIN